MAGGNVDDGHHPLAAGKVFGTVESILFCATTDMLIVQL